MILFVDVSVEANRHGRKAIFEQDKPNSELTCEHSVDIGLAIRGKNFVGHHDKESAS
jgi:hypothetical protein